MSQVWTTTSEDPDKEAESCRTKAAAAFPHGQQFIYEMTKNMINHREHIKTRPKDVHADYFSSNYCGCSWVNSPLVSHGC